MHNQTINLTMVPTPIEVKLGDNPQTERACLWKAWIFHNFLLIVVYVKASEDLDFKKEEWWGGGGLLPPSKSFVANSKTISLT